MFYDQELHIDQLAYSLNRVFYRIFSDCLKFNIQVIFLFKDFNEFKEHKRIAIYVVYYVGIIMNILNIHFTFISKKIEYNIRYFFFRIFCYQGHYGVYLKSSAKVEYFLDQNLYFILLIINGIS